MVNAPVARNVARASGWLSFVLVLLAVVAWCVTTAFDAAEPDAATRRFELAQIYAVNGDTAKGQAQLDEMLRLDGDSNAFYIATVYTLRGDKDKAFEWLERGYTIRDPSTTIFYEDPIVMHALRNDPRMTAFAKKIGIPDPSTVPDPWAKSARP